MGVRLICEVIVHAPECLTPTERLTLVVIAERANDKTRKAWYGGRDNWNAAEIARRVGIAEQSLGKVFTGLAQKGAEVRIPLGYSKKTNKPYFTHRGKQATFYVPHFAPPSERSDDVPTFHERSDDGQSFDEKGRSVVPESSDEAPTLRAERSDDVPTLLLSSSSFPSKKPSSLSPSSDVGSPPVPAGPAGEREDGSSFQEQQPTSGSRPTREPSDIGGILAAHNITGDDADDFRNYADRLPGGPKGLGWYRTLHRNKDLTGHVRDWQARHVNGCGSAGDGLGSLEASICGTHPDQSGYGCPKCVVENPDRWCPEHPGHREGKCPKCPTHTNAAQAPSPHTPRPWQQPARYQPYRDPENLNDYYQEL